MVDVNPAPAAEPEAPPRKMLKWPFLLSYTLFVVFIPAAAAVAAGHVIHSFRRGVRTGLLCIALGPFVVIPLLSLGSGAVGYARGTGVLRGHGLPGPEYRNLDPTCRCHRTSSGCVVDGSEMFTEGPNNFAIDLLTRTFGPMRGTYHGPYPTREEARELIAVGDSRIALDDLKAAPAKVGLPEGTDVDALLSRVSSLRTDAVRLTYATYKGETLLLGRPGSHIVLVDRATGKDYAVYFNYGR